MSPFEQYLSTLGDAEPIAAKYVSDAAFRAERLRERLNDGRIRVMLFGAYNAGKSTLINALLGCEQAIVGDVPTTDAVHKYDWDGHVLLDTPGVNAPIEHEEVTQEELKHTDLILFILRQEDQDAANVMDRLFGLLQENRPLFLLLNYSDSNPEIIESVLNSLNKTMLSEAQKRSYDFDRISRVPRVLVNARTALRARIEKKDKLREHSGYDDFMVRFTDWLRHYDDETKKLQIIRNAFADVLLEPVRVAIMEKLSSDSENEELSLKIIHFQRESRTLRDSSHTKVRNELNLRRPKFGAAFDDGKDAQSVIAAVTKIGEEVSEAVEEWLSKEFEMAMERAINASMHAGDVTLPERQKMSGSPLLDEARDAAVSGIKRGATKENIVELLKLGRTLKIPGLKGKWLKTFDKWAGKAAVPIQLLLSAIEVGLAHHDESRANEQSLNCAMQRNQWVEDVCAQIQVNLTDNIDIILKEKFDEFLHPLIKRKEELRIIASDIELDKMAWEGVINGVEEIRF